MFARFRRQDHMVIWQISLDVLAHNSGQLNRFEKSLFENQAMPQT
jgi:hypothetical protein